MRSRCRRTGCPRFTLLAWFAWFTLLARRLTRGLRTRALIGAGVAVITVIMIGMAVAVVIVTAVVMIVVRSMARAIAVARPVLARGALAR